MSSRATAIGRGVAVQVAARVVALMISLVTISTSTRYLGPTGYGLLAGAIVIVGVFEAVTELGIGQVIVRRVTQGRGELRPLAGANLGFSFLLGPVAVLLATLVGYFLAAGGTEQRMAIAIIAVGLMFTTLGSCASPIFQTRIRFGGAAVADFSSRALALVGTLVVAGLDLGLLALAAVQVIHPFTRMVVSLWSAGRMEPWSIRFDRATSWSLLRESLPLTAMIIVGALYWRADGILVQALSTPIQVGAYGLALVIASNLSVIPLVLAKSALSTLAERRAKDQPAFARTVRTLYHLMLVFGIPVALFGWVYAREVVLLIGGPEFAIAGPVLQLFFIGMAIGFLNPLLSTSLFSAGRQKFLLNFAFVTLGVNIAVNIALVPSMGALGAGYGLIASEAVGVIAATYVLWTEGVAPPDALDIVRILPAVSLGLAAVYLMRDLPALVSGPVVAVLYGATVIATGALPNRIVGSLFARRGRSGSSGTTNAAAGKASDERARV